MFYHILSHLHISSYYSHIPSCFQRIHSFIFFAYFFMFPAYFPHISLHIFHVFPQIFLNSTEGEGRGGGGHAYFSPPLSRIEVPSFIPTQVNPYNFTKFFYLHTYFTQSISSYFPHISADFRELNRLWGEGEGVCDT